ncbi:MAG: ATP-dependent zinc metalloprotease FtsH [Clostridiales bacterium]|nr:ATP-dependent zinc metalloprotease FtsH [Clostridiales bacterium]
MEEPEKLAYSELLAWVEADLKADKGLSEDTSKTITNIIIVENELVARKGNSSISEDDFSTERFDLYATIPSEEQFYTDVNEIYKNVLEREKISPTEYTFVSNSQLPTGTPWWLEFLPYLVIMLLMIGFWFFLMRQQTGGGKGGVMNFSKSRARLTDPSKNKVTFKDVAGADEERDELSEIVEFLKAPARFTKVGARIPKGVILVGPPGTGKTLLARAVAGEAGVPFFTISGSDFVEMFVGVGASRVRDLFDQAKRAAPSIIFIDEIDAVGRQRGAGLGGGHDEREQTLNQLLVEMDGFEHNSGIIVMAATNRVDILDPALLRPGRFDRQIIVNYPDVKGREEILKVHAKNKPLAADVNLAKLARRTPYFTGADLANILNEAAILTARAGKEEITMREMDEAVMRVSAGPEKRSHKITEKDRKMTAYHEAGHAVVSYFLPDGDKVHEISIVPRGMAGGYTAYLPEETNYMSSAHLKARITSALAGYCAERMVFGDVTTGPNSDLKSATNTARRMVTEFGMSDAVGPIFLGGDHEVFLGRDFSQSHANYSQEVAALIDSEIKKLLDDGMAQCEAIFKEHMPKMERLVEILLDREKVDGDEFAAVMEGRPLPGEKTEEQPAEEAKTEE